MLFDIWRGNRQLLYTILLGKKGS